MSVSLLLSAWQEVEVVLEVLLVLVVVVLLMLLLATVAAGPGGGGAAAAGAAVREFGFGDGRAHNRMFTFQIQLGVCQSCDEILPALLVL